MLRLARTRPEWKTLVRKLERSCDEEGNRVFSYDTETVDRGYPDIEIVGFSVGWYEDDGRVEFCYIPVGHNTGEMQLAPSDVNADLKRLLEDPSIEIVMQNAKYDIKISTLFPDPIYVHPNIFDTMLASWFLNTNGVGPDNQVMEGHGSHGLKALSKYLLNHEMEDLLSLAKKERQMKNGQEIRVLRVDLVPIDALGSYAGDDGRQTLLLRQLFKPMLEEDPRVKKVFYVVEREFVFCLAEMEMAGIEVDTEQLRLMRVKVEDELVGIKERMYDLRPGEDFDFVADVALVKKVAEEYERLEYLYTLDKSDPQFPKNPKTGKPAGKGTTRKKLFMASGLDGHPVVEKIRDDKLRQEIIKFPDLAHKIFNPNSTVELNKILFDECYLPPIGEIGANNLWSTKAEYIDVWAETEELAEELKRLREIDKILGTYLIGMAAKVDADHRLRGRLNRIGTRTGRLSSSDPNLQNIPTSEEFPIRKGFVSKGITDATVTYLYEEEDGADEQRTAA